MTLPRFTAIPLVPIYLKKKKKSPQPSKPLLSLFLLHVTPNIPTQLSLCFKSGVKYGYLKVMA